MVEISLYVGLACAYGNVLTQLVVLHTSRSGFGVFFKMTHRQSFLLLSCGMGVPRVAVEPVLETLQRKHFTRGHERGIFPQISYTFAVRVLAQSDLHSPTTTPTPQSQHPLAHTHTGNTAKSNTPLISKQFRVCQKLSTHVLRSFPETIPH